MTSDSERLQSRAEFYLCLAHAFLTPDSDAAWHGLRDALADDLDDLDATLALGIGAEIADYRAAIAATPDQPTLLAIYSALFLAPPRPVAINTGTYLDGALNGGSVLAMEESYRRGGLERSEAFKDLADHLSIQLEFVASRYLQSLEGTGDATEAEKFLAAFVARWLPPFIADLERERAAPNPWLPLARLLHVAVQRDVAGAALAEPSRLQTALDKARHARATHGIDADDMAFIAQRLREKGLAVDHLDTPPELRDEARGWSRKVPPSPRRGSRLG